MSKLETKAMKCKILNSDLILYAENSLPAEKKDELESHLAECSECRSFLALLKESVKVVEQDKLINVNPFLFTKIMTKLGSNENMSRAYIWRLIPAFTFSLLLIAGITAGILLGRIINGNASAYSDDLKEEISYLNDIRQEPIETFFLTSTIEEDE